MGFAFHEGWSRLAGDGFRFLGAGALNTLLTLALYQLLVFWLSPSVAYVVCWMTGFVCVTYAYPRLVFRLDGTRRTAQRTKVAGVYAASFVLGWLIVAGLDWAWGWQRLSIFVSVAVTTVFNFGVMRWALLRPVK